MKGFIFSIFCAIVAIGFSACDSTDSTQESTYTPTQSPISADSSANTQSAESVDSTTTAQNADSPTTPTQNNAESSQSQNAPQSAIDAEKLYSKCVSCHGKDGNNIAPGSVGSVRIATLSKKQIAESLKGYRAQTLNKGGNAIIMYMQTKNLSDSHIEAIANYIGK